MKKQFEFSLLAILLLVFNLIYSMDSAQETSSHLRIMSYNVRRKGPEETTERSWENRKPLIAKLLEASGPDIIGFQEPIKEQIIDLQNFLPDFEQLGRGRGVSWWGLSGDEYNPVFYNAKKFTLIDHGTFFINKLNNTWLGWMPWQARQTGWEPRICTWAKFTIRETGQEFYFYNTHFDHMFSQAQLLCASSVVQDIKERTKDLPVIVTGDFNAPFTAEIKQLFNVFWHARDLARESVGPQETSTGWDHVKLKWIDHILISNKEKINVLRYQVITADNYPSDHRPVITDIILKNVNNDGFHNDQE